MIDDVSTGTTADRADDALRAAAKHNLYEFFRLLSRWSGPQGRLHEADGVLLYAAATEFPITCNGAARTDPGVPDETVLDLALPWFEQLGRGFTLQVQDPDGVDASLVEAAERRGLVRFSTSPAMVRRERLDEVVAPDGIDLRWLGASDSEGSDRETLADDFVMISDRSYQSLGMPAGVIEQMFVDRQALGSDDVRVVVAYERDEPVAAAQLVRTGAVAGVYYVGTVEAARGRGLGELVTAAVTNLGFDLGASFASLQASRMGESIYLRMGYEQIDQYLGLALLR